MLNAWSPEPVDSRGLDRVTDKDHLVPCSILDHLVPCNILFQDQYKASAVTDLHS